MRADLLVIGMVVLIAASCTFSTSEPSHSAIPTINEYAEFVDDVIRIDSFLCLHNPISAYLARSCLKQLKVANLPSKLEEKLAGEMEFFALQDSTNLKTICIREPEVDACRVALACKQQNESQEQH